jgi:hypothetical protein
MSQYAVDRENALAAAIPAERCHDYEAAFQIYRKVLASYPNDAQALIITARAATNAGHIEESIPLFKHALVGMHRLSVSVHESLIEAYTQLGRWQDVDAERIEMRKASLAGDSSLPATGYSIDNLSSGARYMSVVEFPVLNGRFHTRDRFLLYSEKTRVAASLHISIWNPTTRIRLTSPRCIQTKKQPVTAASRWMPTQLQIRRRSSSSISTANPVTRPSAPTCWLS